MGIHLTISNIILELEELKTDPNRQSEIYNFDWKTVSNGTLAEIGYEIENIISELQKKLIEFQTLDK